MTGREVDANRGMAALGRLVRDPVRLAAAEFLRTLGERYGGWAWDVTLTMRGDVPADRVLQGVRFLARALAVGLGDHYAMALAFEFRHGLRGAHTHALLGGEAVHRLPKREIERVWKISDDLAGFSRVTRHRPGPGAALYLTKEREAWSAGIVCPRVGNCAHRKCRVGPAPF